MAYSGKKNQYQAEGQLYTRLRKAIGEIRAVDAHEHLPDEEIWLKQSPGAAFLSGYIYCDLVSAGMPQDRNLLGSNLEEIWRRIRPFWPNVRGMGGAALLRRMLSLFLGIDEINDEVIPVVSEGLARLQQPGIYEKLLEKEYNIEVCVNCSFDETGNVITSSSSTACFAPLLYTAVLSLVQKRSDIARLEARAEQDVYSLKTYLSAVDALLENSVKNGLVGIKWHKLAYLRDISYPSGDERAAERCLERILRMPARNGIGSDTPVGFDEMRPFQDYMQHYLIRRAIDLDLPVQVHTGTLGGSHGAQIAHTNPTHLVDLFLQYPQARFDLLHGSYPFMRELGALAKLFPNVFINTAWLEVLSPRAARAYLHEWISSVPINKIIAFGGDQSNILLSCACVEIVRDKLARILACDVEEGLLAEEEALQAASRLLRDNAREHFKLQTRWYERNKRSGHGE